MSQFHVYKRNRDTYEPEYIAIKVGFSFPGLFFTVVWAFVKGLWTLGFILMGIIFLTSISTAFLFSNKGVKTIANLFGLAMSVYVGYNGNYLLGEELLKRGFTFVGLYEGNRKQSIIEAKNKKDNETNNNKGDSSNITTEN
jgi:Protein of unknown function (DUF2628)